MFGGQFAGEQQQQSLGLEEVQGEGIDWWWNFNSKEEKKIGQKNKQKSRVLREDSVEFADSI